MELLFKSYDDRPSRMGIVFTYSFQAVRAYELLLSKGQGQQFYLKLEILKSTLKLKLTSEQNGFIHIYKDVNFKAETLKKLIYTIDQKTALEFVHVYKEGNSPFIAKPFGKQKFIALSEVGIFNSESFRVF